MITTTVTILAHASASSDWATVALDWAAVAVGIALLVVIGLAIWLQPRD